MKKAMVCVLILGCVLIVNADASPSVNINVDVEDLGFSRWQYTYEVINIDLPKIMEFTINYDYGLYKNLAITTSDPLLSDWDEIIWQPDALIGDDGGYDALCLGDGIAAGESVSGFSVSFDWLGNGDAPGMQLFDIVNPNGMNIIGSGITTVPAPGALLLASMGCGLIGMIKRRRGLC